MFRGLFWINLIFTSDLFWAMTSFISGNLSFSLILSTNFLFKYYKLVFKRLFHNERCWTWKEKHFERRFFHNMPFFWHATSPIAVSLPFLLISTLYSSFQFGLCNAYPSRSYPKWSDHEGTKLLYLHDQTNLLRFVVHIIDI